MNGVTPDLALNAALDARVDLDQYKHSKRLLFAAQVLLGIEDIHAVAADALTDGSGDRSCDFVYVDRDAGIVVLAQAYEATRRRVVAEAKVQSLHQAVDWLLTKELKGLPARLESAISSAREALKDGEIRHLKIWFVHNLDDQPQVHDALTGARDAAQNALDSRYPEVASEVRVESLEVSSPQLAAWYQSYESPIAVKEIMRLPWNGGQRISGPGWEALQTSVPMSWLAGQYWSYGETLFSANVRDYLGRVNRASNINNGIRMTLQQEPENFFVYNNGITALVEHFEIDDEGRLLIKGLSIVNGAQTTGVLTGNEGIDLEQAHVGIRFIKCQDQSIVEKIIKRNNRQNSVAIEDFRSNDRTQRRLAKEFSDLGVSNYVRPRRGGSQDAVRRVDIGAVRATYAARALVSFHGDPVTAHRNPASIWDSNSLYRRYFNEDTTARHFLLCWGAGKAVEERRLELRNLPRLQGGKRKQLDYLQCQGATWLLIAAIADCLVSYLDELPKNLFRVELADPVGPSEAIALWRPIVRQVTPFAPEYLQSLVAQSTRWNPAQQHEILSNFGAAVQPVLEDADDLWAAFSGAVQVRS
ncbi:AIPR family protein [Sphaerisporangium perillae]|uniref:AIPR family protein n=1 Tax=Sphaerisporangium perillae TaxID=2935860 RepID=UPI00200D20DD|nr:AIPR family protein [Sphaerisporangium perillae]